MFMPHTTGSSSTVTVRDRSIISSASNEICLACATLYSGRPDTAMYLSPTVSTFKVKLCED